MSQSYEVIFENNRKWQETKRQQCPDYFKDLADGQNPEYLYIGLLRQPRCGGRADGV